MGLVYTNTAKTGGVNRGGGGGANVADIQSGKSSDEDCSWSGEGYKKSFCAPVATREMIGIVYLIVSR